MSGDNEDVIDALNDLAECCKDGEYGFRACAEQAKRSDLKSLFLQRADDCRGAAQELYEQIRMLGGDVEEGGSAAGAMHRGWVAVKATLTTYDDKAVLEECERGEDNAMARYRKALEAAAAGRHQADRGAPDAGRAAQPRPDQDAARPVPRVTEDNEARGKPRASSFAMGDERSSSHHSLKTYREKRNFDVTPEPAAGGVANEEARTFVIQKHWATPAALRLPPRARRHDEELGRAQGPQLRPGRQAHGRACRGPSDLVHQLRRHDPAGQLRRGQGHHLGQGRLDSAGGPARGLSRRQAQVRAARPQAARPLDAGAHEGPRRRTAGAVAADQGEGRLSSGPRRSSAWSTRCPTASRRWPTGRQPCRRRRPPTPRAQPPPHRARPRARARPRCPRSCSPQLATLVDAPPQGRRTTGSTRSSSTATACSRASRAAACA